MKTTDKAGNEINVGDYIVYGHALGRCAGLRYGKVLEIKASKGYYDEGKPVLSVQGVDDDWKHRKPELCARKGTLGFPNERVLVIKEDQLPQYVKDLFASPHF